MTTEILDAEVDDARWKAVLSTLPPEAGDIYFQPEYVRAHLFHPGSRGILFVYRDGSDVWACPTVVSSLPEHIAKSTGARADAETAYGYGGPISTTASTGFVEGANNALVSWYRENGVIAEFIRLHPLIAEQDNLLTDASVTFNRETFSIDLARPRSVESLFRATARNNLRRADRLGVRPSMRSGASAFEEFGVMYRGTMSRLNAERFYHFTSTFFNELTLLAPDKCIVIEASVDEQCAAAGIFLMGSKWIHFHLGSSRVDGFVPGAMNLVMVKAIEFARSTGLNRLHLGGGRTSDPKDSLLRFKRTMATDSHRFLTGKRIMDEPAYTAIREAWRMTHPELDEKYGARVLCYRYAPA